LPAPPTGRPRTGAGQAPGIGEEPQRPLGADLRIDLAQRAGGEVAGIGVGALAGLEGGGVEGGEGLQLDIDLAADLDHVGPAGALQLVGDVGDGPQVGGDVLAHPAVAPRRALDQHALLVAQRGRQTVDLRLGGVEHRLAGQAQEAADAGVELGRLVVGKGVVEAQHRHAVLDRRELLGPRGADPQGRRVFADQLGEAGLDVQVAALEGVVLGVGDRRGVLLVIAQVVGGQLVGQPRQLGIGLVLGEVGDGDLGHGRIRRLGNGGRLAGGG
jgi:hypothetical protein